MLELDVVVDEQADSSMGVRSSVLPNGGVVGDGQLPRWCKPSLVDGADVDVVGCQDVRQLSCSGKDGLGVEMEYFDVPGELRYGGVDWGLGMV